MPARRFRRRAPRRARRARRHLRRGRKGGILAVPRSMHSSPDQYASLTESILFKDTLPNIPSYRRCALSSFFRATSVAPNYKWYKVAKCTWTYTPLYNTFQENGSSVAVAKPQILFQMNRTQDSLQNTTDFDMLSMGSKPQQFVKNKVISYVPNWCSPGLIATSADPDTGFIKNVYQSGLRANTDWLASPPIDPYVAASAMQPLTDGNLISAKQAVTDLIVPGNVEYNGHIDYVYQENATAPVYTLVLTVTWLFKQPVLYTSIGKSIQPKVPTASDAN